MTKYQGKIEAKEQKVSKTNTQYILFTIEGKKWNCFDAIANQEFKVGHYIEFETEISASKDSNGKNYENLLPETMKIINAPATPKVDASKTEHIVQMQERVLQAGWKNETTCKNINENPDSLEIGTPGKGGAIKIYHNYDDPEGFLIKILNAKTVRDEANKLIGLE